MAALQVHEHGMQRRGGNAAVIWHLSVSSLLIIVALSSCLAGAAQGAVRVVAAASEEIYVGEPFQYQIIIDGSDQEAAVDIGPLAKWSPVSAGGRNLSQRSETIINGRRTVHETKRYVMVYELSTGRAGSAVIPAVEVRIDGDVSQSR